jgi:hypothetical protein
MPGIEKKLLQKVVESIRDVPNSTTKQLPGLQMPPGKIQQNQPIPETLIPLFGYMTPAMNGLGFDLQGELVYWDCFKNWTIL